MILIALLLTAQDPTAGPPVTTASLPDDWLRHAGIPPYPPEAYRRGESGNTGVDLHIDAAGKVRSCSVGAPSGSRSLDEASCPFARRIRWNPARDAAGRPVDSVYRYNMVWNLPPPPSH